MKTRFLLIGVLILAFVSCENKNDPSLTGKPELIGSWVSPSYTDSTVNYSKGSKLVDNQYGITFLAAGKFVERTNSGWCGTPPVTLTDNNGTWSMRDSVISIKVAYWGGEAVYKWKIISVTADKLKVKILSQNYNLAD